MGAVWLEPQVLLWYQDQRFWFPEWKSLRVGPRDNRPRLCSIPRARGARQCADHARGAEKAACGMSKASSSPST